MSRFGNGGMEVSAMGDCETGAKRMFSGESLDSVFFIYLIEGSATVSLSDVGKCKLGAGDVLVIFPGRVLTVDLTAKRNRMMFLALRGSSAVDSVQKLGYWDMLRSKERYRLNMMETALGIFKKSQEAGRDPELLDLVGSLLDTVWVRLRNGSGQRELFDAVRMVNALPCNQMTTEHAAEILNVSRSKLNSIFMEGMGIRPGEYLARVRTALVLASLYWTKQSVGAVAKKMGFSSASALACFLHRRIGCTPAEFRRRPVKC